MRSATHVQPGQTLGCVGCHDSRGDAPPPSAPLLASLREPSRITVGPEGSWTMRFDKLIQPVLDAKCVRCHDPKGPDAEAAKFDLTPKHAYQSLTRSGRPSLNDLVLAAYREGVSTEGRTPRSQSGGVAQTGGSRGSRRGETGSREPRPLWYLDGHVCPTRRGVQSGTGARVGTPARTWAELLIEPALRLTAARGRHENHPGGLPVGVLFGIDAPGGGAFDVAPTNDAGPELQGLLDAPLLFVKRHSYTGIHIYDTYYKWPPGGGGIYVLENPAAPREPVEDPPGDRPHHARHAGLRRLHPSRTFLGRQEAAVLLQGRAQRQHEHLRDRHRRPGLRRVTRSRRRAATATRAAHGGQHDIAPAYLPDGRIVFLSTRPSGLVPCANTGVSILHVMNADGSRHAPDLGQQRQRVRPGRAARRADPVRPLGIRRQECPDDPVAVDGATPTARRRPPCIANNMVFPEAILDARPVPGTPLVVGTLAKHNSTPRGSIALIDPRLGKNDPAALDEPRASGGPDLRPGDSCEPWPLYADMVLFSGRPAGQKRNVLEMIDRAGHRITRACPTRRSACTRRCWSSRGPCPPVIARHDRPHGNDRPVLRPGRLPGPDGREARRGEVAPGHRGDLARQSHHHAAAVPTTRPSWSAPRWPSA